MLHRGFEFKELIHQKSDKRTRWVSLATILIFLGAYEWSKLKASIIKNFLLLSECHDCFGALVKPQSCIKLSVGLQVASAVTVSSLLPAFQLLMSYLYFRYGHPWKRNVLKLNLRVFLTLQTKI